MLRIIIFILLCYAIGSFSPSYLLGRIQGIDLRAHGTKNLGATNALFILGKATAAATLLIDAGKGVGAVAIGAMAGLHPLVIYACILAAILGHVFPFYLQFHGGKGVATAIGAALGLVLFSRHQYLPFVGVAVLALISYAIGMMCYRTVKLKQPDIKPIRKLVRLCGAVFPLVYYWYGRNAALWLTLSVLIIFGLIDLLRLSNQQLNKNILEKLSFFVKKKETKMISTTTTLLISLLASIYLFDKTIVLITSILFIVSDAVAEIYGKSYGKHELFNGKTAEGTAAGLAANLFLSMALFTLLDVSIETFLIASIAVSGIEVLSYKIDDNLTTIVIAGYLVQLFNSIF